MTIPRNANGWPTIPPSHFTYLELIAEARAWKGCAHDHNTVGRAEWDKYTDELERRLFMTRVQREEAVLPDEVPGPEAAARHKKWSTR